MFTPKFSSTDGSFSSNFHKYEFINGEDGFSPIIETVPIENGYQITITDKDKTTSFELTNGQDGKTPFFKSEGDDLLISYDKENWIVIGRIKGDKGDTGNGIIDVIFEEDYKLTFVFDNLPSYTTPISLIGPKGKDGQNGKDGDTPYIGENGNWWIGENDTGVTASGEGGSIDLPLSKGTGENSIVIAEGEAIGDNSIAGGTTNLNVIESVLGEGYADLIEKYGAVANMPDSIINLILNAADVGYTAAEFKRIATVSPSVAEALLSISLGTSNKSKTAASISLGYGNIAGAKGYYITDINTSQKTITLSTQQSSMVTPSSVDWSIGDRLFIVNDDRYWAEIADKNGNVITLVDMPFSSLASLKTVSIPLDGTYDITNPTERSVINIDKPESGAVDIGWGAIAIGSLNQVLASCGYGVGYKNVIAGDFGTALGQDNIVGYSAFATGVSNQALGKASIAEGNQNIASGNGAHAEGGHTSASGRRSHAEGENTQAIGDRSHAEGNETIANGNNSHTEGTSTIATGNSAHAEGAGAHAKGNNSHAEGANNITNGNNSHAEGWNNIATGGASHVEGEAYEHTDGAIYSNIAEGAGSHSEGQGARAVGLASHAEGGGEWDKNKKDFIYTVAEGIKSHAEGVRTTAKGTGSHAEGYKTVAEGIYSHAEGISTLAVGNHSHVEGADGVAFGNNSHVEGWNCSTAQGAGASHAGGEASQAEAYGAFAHGAYLRATEKYQTVFGKGNIANSNALFIIGNAELDDDDRVTVPSNAFEVLQNGSIIIGGVELTPAKLEKLIKFIDSIEEY